MTRALRGAVDRRSKLPCSAHGLLETGLPELERPIEGQVEEPRSSTTAPRRPSVAHRRSSVDVVTEQCHHISLDFRSENRHSIRFASPVRALPVHRSRTTTGPHVSSLGWRGS